MVFAFIRGITHQSTENLIVSVQYADLPNVTSGEVEVNVVNPKNSADARRRAIVLLSAQLGVAPADIELI